MASRPWADGPLALIPTPVFLTKKEDMFRLGASEMAQMHNSVFRGYNSIYLQAPYIQETEKSDFIGYCLTWYKLVETHAKDEEANLFPKVEELLGDKVFAETHKEHDAFLPAMSKFHTYLTSLKSPSEFNASKLLEIMDIFQGPFESHFRSEISTIEALCNHPRTPKEGTPEQVRASEAFDKWGRNALIKAGLTDVVPFFLFNTDRSYEDGLWTNWPPIPGPVRWGLLNIAGRFHSDQWRFASCDASGQPRELYALKA